MIWFLYSLKTRQTVGDIDPLDSFTSEQVKYPFVKDLLDFVRSGQLQTASTQDYLTALSLASVSQVALVLWLSYDSRALGPVSTGFHLQLLE